MSAQPDRPSAKRRSAPRGVLLIGILLILIAFFSAGIGSLVRAEALTQVDLTRPLLLSFALVTGILAYGLLRLRRWAWAATLMFVIVQASFILLDSLLDGTTQTVGLALLAIVAVYMLLPGVRNVFLRK